MPAGKRAGIAWLNLASGALTLTEVPLHEAAGVLERVAPAELLVPEEIGAARAARARAAGARAARVAIRPRGSQSCAGEATGTLDLAGFGADEVPLAIGAAGALLYYAGATQQAALAHVRTLTVELESEFVALDPATRRNLEITTTLSGDEAPTLHSLLDGCASAAGSRLLRQWLTQPLRSQARLAARHDGIAAFRVRRRRAARSPKRSGAPSTSSASWDASRCAMRARATSRDCAIRWRACRRCLPPRAISTCPSSPAPARVSRSIRSGRSC